MMQSSFSTFSCNISLLPSILPSILPSSYALCFAPRHVRSSPAMCIRVFQRLAATSHSCLVGLAHRVLLTGSLVASIWRRIARRLQLVSLTASLAIPRVAAREASGTHHSMPWLGHSDNSLRAGRGAYRRHGTLVAPNARRLLAARLSLFSTRRTHRRTRPSVDVGVVGGCRCILEG